MTMEERISNFASELKEYFSQRDNDFKVRVKCNEIDGVFFIYHNDLFLDQDPAFRSFVADKADDHFFS